MGDWNATILFESFPNAIKEDDLSFIWDNFTSGEVIQPIHGHKYFIFIIGIAFLSSLFVGMFLHWFYLFLLSKFAPEDGDDSPDGFYNPAFVEDESQQPANDHPPSYDCVMSGASSVEAPRDSLGDILKRFLIRKEAARNADLQLEESPPSYSAAIANLQLDFSNQ